MAQFLVEITRTVITRIAVDAASPAAARRQIIEYGAIEAASDYRPNEEWQMPARIKSVVAA